MNVNSINAMHSVQNLSKAQSFKGQEKAPEVKPQAKMTGLECLAAMLTPHKHFVEVEFGDKSFNLSSGITTIDDQEKEVISNIDVDMAEGKTKSDIINSILKNTTNIEEFAIHLGDGSTISVFGSKENPNQFRTVLTKDGTSEVIQEIGFGAKSEMSQIEAYKKAIFFTMNSFEAENIKSITLSTLK